MKNRHNDVLQPIRAIPFIFSADSFGAGGFSTLRNCPSIQRGAYITTKRVVTYAPPAEK
jgi:hypothetical protein